MGNIFNTITTKTYIEDKDPPDPTRIGHPSSMGPEPIIVIPIDTDMSQSPERTIHFRVRQAASDNSATVEAHQDHRVSTLKRHLITHVAMPFPDEDGKCKICMVWNKPSLLRDEPLPADELIMDRRYLGGSIDHLRLGEYGLENGDFLMFTVMFPQIFNASSHSLK